MAKKILKKILRSSTGQKVIGALAASYIWLVIRTARWQIEGEVPPDGSYIFCFWHNRLLLMAMSRKLYDGGPVHMLISGHPDGRVIANAMGHFKIQTIAGSRRKGGAAAFRDMLKVLKAGESVCVTPDGPKGPAEEVAVGTMLLAQKVGVAMVPIAAATKRAKILKTWDKFMLSLPFSRAAFVIGPPQMITKDAIEPQRVLFEQALQAITYRADELAGSPLCKTRVSNRHA